MIIPHSATLQGTTAHRQDGKRLDRGKGMAPKKRRNLLDQVMPRTVHSDD